MMNSMDTRCKLKTSKTECIAYILRFHEPWARVHLADLGFRFDTLRNMRRRDLLLAALAPSGSPNLRDVAAVHAAIAEKDTGRKIWGRIGGTAPEHESAAALVKQLTPFLPKVELEA